MEFDIRGLSEPILGDKPIVVGKLKNLNRSKRIFGQFENAIDISLYKENNEEDCFENGLPFIPRITGNILQIYSRDHLIKKVYLYNEKEVYEQDYSDTEQKSEIFVKHKYYINVPLDEIENGNYKIALKIGEYNYTTDYWFKKTIFI